MKKEISLNLNYFDPDADMNELIKKEFYAAREWLYNQGYDDYSEDKALPLSPKDEHLFAPLAIYRVKDMDGNFDWIRIYARALGGILIISESEEKKETEKLTAELKAANRPQRKKRTAKKNIVRYIVTDVVSVPVCRIGKKSEAYRTATGAGWGIVEWYSEVTTDRFGNPCAPHMVIANRDPSDKTQVMYCDDDSSAVIYPKCGRDYVIAPYEEINLKDAPSQSEMEAIIISHSCGHDFWETDKGDIKIFVTYDENGLIDDYRLDNWSGKPYDGETEISFDDLQSEEEHDKTNRADIVGTFEYTEKMNEAANTPQKGNVYE